MSFKDCILGKIEEGKLTKSSADKLLKKYDAHLEKFRNSGTPEQVAVESAQKLIEHESMQMQLKQRNQRIHAMKQKQWNDWANSTPGEIETKVRDTLQRASWRGEGVAKETYAFLNEVGDLLKVNFTGTSRNFDVVNNAWRSALGETVQDPNAVKLGQAFRKVNDYLHGRYRQAGGIVGKLDNYMPQITRKETLLRNKIPKDMYTDIAMKHLDIDKMIDHDTGLAFTPEKLREVVGEVYDDIITDGRFSQAERSVKGKGPKRGSTDMDTKRIDSRFFKFKSADDFMAYNNAFGYGEKGLAQAFLEHIHSMSRDIGTMEVMSPKANALMRFADYKMAIEGSSPYKRLAANSEYRVLTSSFQHGDTNAMWWRTLTGTQNWLRSALLGSAPISAIADGATMSATALVNGLSATRAMKNYFASVSPLDNEMKQIASRSGFLAHALGGRALGDTRFAGETLGDTGKLARTLANMTNEFSGLGWHTKSIQDAISLEGMATIAENISGKTKWADLNTDLKKSLGRFGIDESDWGKLSAASLYDNGEAKFLITSDLRMDEGLSLKDRTDIANKLDDWTFSMRQMAATEPTLATRAWTTGAMFGDGGMATPSRAVGSTLGLFKSFPITHMMVHLKPAIDRAMSGTGLRRFDHLALVTVGSTLLGAVAMQMRALTQGKTRRDMDQAKFWIGAMLQGGGLGLFGDFMFGDYSRFDRSPITEMGGPVVGLMDDLLSATKGNLDKQISDWDTGSTTKRHVGRDLFRVMKRNIPMGSLWYARLGIERLLLDNLERLADPEFDSRVNKYARKMNKQTGQEYWWKPGEPRPR